LEFNITEAAHRRREAGLGRRRVSVPHGWEILQHHLGGDYQFTVLEIGKEGWVKVVMRQRNQTAWISTNAVPIAPYPFKGVQNPP
jgi:hypothetical protein